MKIAVWFSCGAASAVAAKLALEKYGKEHEVIVLNNPVLEEDEDNRRFRDQVSEWLGVKIVLVINPKWPAASAAEVWDKRKFMSGPKGAPCTGELKIQARQIWEKHNVCDWHVLGFTVEEKNRFERFKLTERKNTVAPLVDNGNRYAHVTNDLDPEQKCDFSMDALDFLKSRGAFGQSCGSKSPVYARGGGGNIVWVELCRYRKDTRIRAG